MTREEQRPAIVSQQVDTMLVVGLEDVDITWPVLTLHPLTLAGTALLSVPTHEDEAQAPAPWMGVDHVMGV
jgi:hypothetical protein